MSATPAKEITAAIQKRDESRSSPITKVPSATRIGVIPRISATVVAFAAPGALGHAASPSAGAARAVYCPPDEKKRRQAALKTFVRKMVLARKRYFRTHPKAKDRVAFVKAQRRQLKALQRALAQCD